MHNSLVILLHRPFVADGHLYSTSPSISVDSFKKCASAASNISKLLRDYHRVFSIRRAPYLISYATYVAATILTRIAARRRNDSTAHSNLATCLAVFQENQETNSAVKKATKIVQGLMKKLGVVINDVSLTALDLDQNTQPDNGTDGSVLQQTIADENSVNGPTTGNAAVQPTANRNHQMPSPGSDTMDIDGIIQSFLRESDGRLARPADHEADGVFNHHPQMPLPQPNYASVSQPNRATRSFANGDPALLRPDTQTPGESRQWEYWGLTADEAASLEDPLFGFNGSSMDGFPFSAW